MMKKMRSVLLFVSLWLSASGAAVFGAPSGFSISVPAGWTTKEGSASLAHYMKGVGSLIVTADTMPANASAPDSYVAFVKERLMKAFPKAVFEPVLKGKKGPHETRELRYSAEMSGIKLKYDIFYVFRNGKAYTLTAGNIAAAFDDSFSKDVTMFFSSFALK